jgi:hypothetical protein
MGFVGAGARLSLPPRHVLEVAGIQGLGPFRGRTTPATIKTLASDESRVLVLNGGNGRGQHSRLVCCFRIESEAFFYLVLACACEMGVMMSESMPNFDTAICKTSLGQVLCQLRRTRSNSPTQRSSKSRQL